MCAKGGGGVSDSARQITDVHYYVNLKGMSRHRANTKKVRPCNTIGMLSNAATLICDLSKVHAESAEK